MRSPEFFIVKPKDGKRYDNTRTYGEVEFISNSSIESADHSNRFAIVESTPIGYKGAIKKGDTLLVHHNVFKFYYDMQGREKSGRSFFQKDLFFVDFDQFFLYKTKDEEWKAHSKYCFIKPAKEEDYYIKKFTNEEPLVGTIRYINEELLNLGLNVGDKVCYEPDSEYEFRVDGEKLYRMFTNNLVVKV